MRPVEELANIGGFEYRIVGQESDSRSWSYVIRDGVASIRIPSHLPEEKAAKAFAELRSKVIDRIRKHPSRYLGMAKIEFGDGEEAELLGRRFRIKVLEGRAQKVSSAKLDGDTVLIRPAKSLDEKTKREHISKLARRAISKAVMPDVEARIRNFNSEHFGFELNGIKIKDTMTMWGSNSARTGNINLNFRLLFAPSGIFEYVVAHELAHLRQHNHSKAFWALVENAVPDYKISRKWIRENGHTLGRKTAVYSPIIPKQEPF